MNAGTKLATSGLLLLLLASCGPGDPLAKLQRELDRYPEYSIILEDMRTGGNFVAEYHHRYKVVTGEQEEGSEDLVYRDQILDWERVKADTYRRHEGFLGMTVASKSLEGEVEEVPQPPGYRYVGDSRYGNWRTDSSGNSFWEFYGKYALLSHLFGSLSRPIYRGDWDSYTDHRRRRQPYYGPNKEYGTSGSYTQKTHRNFYERQRVRQASSRQRFGERVNSRSRSSSTRSRSSSRGGK